MSGVSAQANLANVEDKKSHRAAIDASCRVPVLFAFGTAIFWLIVGSLFALVASNKFDQPWLLENFSWLTFGRVRTVHLNTVIYGWASLAGIGVAIWLMARLCRTLLQGQTIIMIGLVLWNIGVAVGSYGILAGDSTSIEWLEFPKYSTPLIFFGFALVAIWAVLMFTKRPPGHVYVSQWYLMLALFSLPWLYATAQILLLFQPVQGSVVGIINWWFGHNTLGLWFTPLGLAAAYYLIPKVLGRPVHSYFLSIVGFWTLAFFYNWNGAHHLIGGPVPAWIVTVSIVASVMMVIPVLTVAINHHMTVQGNFDALRYSPTLRFVVFGSMAYTFASLQGISMAIRPLNTITHFTHYTIGHSHVGVYGFFTMIMFGSIYYIVPRLVQWEWPSATLIRVHFWAAAIGISLMVVTLMCGGFLQGLALLDAKVPFGAITDMAVPFLWVRTFSGILLTIGHFAFAASFVMILIRWGSASKEATLLQTKEVAA